MTKTVKSNPLMIAIAEKVGTTVGMIVAKTTDAVEGATRMVGGAAKPIKREKAVPARAPKRAARRKAGTMKKKAVPAAEATTRKRKRPVKK